MAPLTNFNDGGGSDRGSYFIPKKITTSEFVYPKKITTFSNIPKKIPWSLFRNPKNSLFYLSQPQKITGRVFHRPKKITFGQNFRPPSLKYVSGAPGRWMLINLLTGAQTVNANPPVVHSNPVHESAPTTLQLVFDSKSASPMSHWYKK